MGAVNWQPDLSVGVPELDAQHRRLIDTLNELHEALQGGRAPGRVRPLLAALVQHAGGHFAAEERYLRETHYARHDEHRAEHVRLMDQVFDLKRGLENADGTVPGAETIAFLRDWLVRHIVVADRQYAVRARATRP